MKKVYLTVLIIALIVLAASSVYSYANGTVENSPYGCYYKTDYEIPATLNDYSNVSWHNVGHNGFVNKMTGEPEEVTIIDISGETCTIIEEFESIGKTYADDVPLADLSYDPGLVETAKKTDNNFQIDIYHGSGSVTVDYGNGDIHFYSVPYGNDYPEECLRHKEQSNVYFPIMIVLTIAFVVLNAVLGAVILINTKLKKSANTPCIIATVLNVIILFFPVVYLLESLRK